MEGVSLAHSSQQKPLSPLAPWQAPSPSAPVALSALFWLHGLLTSTEVPLHPSPHWDGSHQHPGSVGYLMLRSWDRAAPDCPCGPPCGQPAPGFAPVLPPCQPCRWGPGAPAVPRKVSGQPEEGAGCRSAALGPIVLPRPLCQHELEKEAGAKEMPRPPLLKER